MIETTSDTVTPEQTATPERAAEPKKTTTAQFEKSPMSVLSTDSPAIRELFIPSHRDDSWVNDTKLRRLYIQASAQQWFAPQKIDFELQAEMPEEQRLIWIKLMTIFYTLEKMGLNVIANMMPKATNRLRSEEATYYLAAQCYDEARHVFAVENYLRKLGQPPKYDWTLHVLGQTASLGFYRVENWLFSTLFSENFASVFLRRARVAQIDKLGAEMCRHLLVDESRHLHFLHIVLPDIMDRLSFFGRSYVKLSQRFIMNFTERVSRSVEGDAALVGIDRRGLLEEVFENIERAYEGFGVSRDFLSFPKIKNSTAH